MKKKETIETRVAEAVLQQPMEVAVGKSTYLVAPPSVATLILASEAVSRLPAGAMDEQRVLEETLAKAEYCRPLGEVAAILILGAKGLTETVKVKEKQCRRYLFGLFHLTRTVEVERIVNRKEQLADDLLENLTPSELNLLISQILRRMQIADFFGLTTFLTGANLLRPTKVEEES
jgi:hypothetical protein